MGGAWNEGGKCGLAGTGAIANPAGGGAFALVGIGRSSPGGGGSSSSTGLTLEGTGLMEDRFIESESVS